MSEHAPLSFSGSSRWLECTGSLHYEQTLPEPPSGEAAEIGTHLHDVAATRLVDKSAASTPIDPDFERWVAAYVAYCEAVQARRSKNALLLVEHRVSLTPLAWGTSDAIVVGDTTLDIIDFKTGQRRVTATGNTQLMLYALAAMKTLTLGRGRTVTLHIVQPSIDWVDTWTLDADGLELAYIEERVRDVQRAYEAGNWDFRPSESACTYCRGKNVCKARAQQALDVAYTDFGPQPVVDLIPEDYARILPHLKAIETWCEDIRTHCTGLMQRGIEIPGFKLGEGPTLRRWTDAETAIAALVAAGVPESQAVRREPMTIGAAEKLIGKNHPVFKELCTRSEPKPKVVPV